jgi:hypothetical protein
MMNQPGQMPTTVSFLDFKLSIALKASSQNLSCKILLHGDLESADPRCLVYHRGLRLVRVARDLCSNSNYGPQWRAASRGSFMIPPFARGIPWEFMSVQRARGLLKGLSKVICRHHACVQAYYAPRVGPVPGMQRYNLIYGASKERDGRTCSSDNNSTEFKTPHILGVGGPTKCAKARYCHRGA